MVYTIDGETNYANLFGTVNSPYVITASHGWVELNFDYLMAYDAEQVSLYIESRGDTASFYIDDFCVTYLPTAALVEVTSFAAIPDISAGTVGSATYANATEVIADLPTRVAADTSSGTVSVPVNEWVDTDTYNPNIAGSYTFTAILGAIPAGYANTGNYTAKLEVVIKPKLTDAEVPTITSQPQSMTVNVGDTAILFVEAETASGTLSYQWYSNTTDTTTAGAIKITTTTEAAIQVPTNTVGTTYYFCIITNTDNSKPGTKTATTQSVIVPVTVALNTYSLTYTAGANGTITGIVNQTVAQGGSGSAVTAIPNNGYHFVDWSDGVKTATRTDRNVTGNIAVTAIFAANTNTGGNTGGNSGGNSGGSTSGSTTTTPVVEAKPVQAGVVTLVNGKADTSATVTTTKVEGKTATTVTLDNKKIQEMLKTESAKSIITIQVNINSDVVAGQLNGQTVKNMENKDAVLEIKTGNVTYTLPVSQINIDRVAEQFGAQTNLKDITVNVTIADSSNDTAQIVQDIADKNHYQVVVKPVEFEITCISETKSVEVFKFNSYVERTIAIPDGVDPSKVTTAVVVNKDGTFSHVPTTIVSIDGKYYSKINSLTNSTYTLIWNPITFKDVENHWAKSYINDVGSRLIDSGVGDGNFAPNSAITRAEFASMIVNALGLKGTNFPDKFSDVKKGDPYYYYIYTAYEYGILSGYSNGKFGTNDLITREQAMTMLANAIKIAGMDVSVSQEDIADQLKLFKDSGNISLYAKEEAAICIKNGIIGGNEGNITPKNSFTRAESATVVIKLLKKAKLI